MTDTAQIEKYLADEELLFADWYIELNAPDDSSGFRPVAKVPPKEKVEAIFEAWFKKNYKTLKAVLCTAKNAACEMWLCREEIPDWQKTIIALVEDALSLAGLAFVSILKISIILVSKGYLDRICEVENKS